MIFHLTEPARWRRSLDEGSHTGSTRGVELDAEGFIHCSTAEQWSGVIDRFYAGVPELVLLHVDESKLTAPLRWEAVGGASDPDGELFPHVYGPIDLAAVIRVEIVRTDSSSATRN